MDFREESVQALAVRVQNAEVSSRELTEAALSRIEELNPSLGAFVSLDGESAMEQAAAIDERVARGEDVGPLAGLPLGVKDTEDALGFRTTVGSRLLADSPVSKRDSILVDRLRQAGCVIVGKTNTPELAWKGDTDNLLFGRTSNPWSLHRSAGGSSGGSAAAVAAGMVPIATGSDGGGSLRIPAALCGLSTLKPSLGRVPAGGPRPPAWADLSSKGVLTRTIADTALALDTVIGPDPTDLRSLPMPEQSWVDAIEEVHGPRRVVWSPTLGYAAVDPEIRAVCEQAMRALDAAGTEVVVIDDIFDADPSYSWFYLAMLSNLRTFEGLDPAGERWDDIDPDLAALAQFARDHATVTEAIKVQDVAHHLNLRLVEVFHTAPLLLTPTVAGQTPVGAAHGLVHGIEDSNWVRFTYPFNLTRSPAGSLCAGFTSDGMPVGLQVVGPQHADVAVLRMIAHLEALLDVDTFCPI